jgi:hypothetical protein
MNVGHDFETWISPEFVINNIMMLDRLTKRVRHQYESVLVPVAASGVDGRCAYSCLAAVGGLDGDDTNHLSLEAAALRAMPGPASHCQPLPGHDKCPSYLMNPISPQPRQATMDSMSDAALKLEIARLTGAICSLSLLRLVDRHFRCYQ